MTTGRGGRRNLHALLALAIVIAEFGIANPLSLSVYERTRKIGLLRAVGQARSQLRSTVRLESGLVSAFGTVGGLLPGGFLAGRPGRGAGRDPAGPPGGPAAAAGRDRRGIARCARLSGGLGRVLVAVGGLATG